MPFLPAVLAPATMRFADRIGAAFPPRKSYSAKSPGAQQHAGYFFRVSQKIRRNDISCSI